MNNLIAFAIGVILTALLFNHIIRVEHKANSDLYKVLNECDQSLKKCSEKCKPTMVIY